MSDRLKSYAEFWPFYLGEHRRPLTRTLHLVGTGLGLPLFVAGAIVGVYWLMPVGVLFGYVLAWTAHFFVEHNRPATAKYPLWSLFSDLRMLALACSFRLGRELRRRGIPS